MADAVIKALSGTVNGVNKTFTTPSKYIAGTLRAIANGQSYESDDTRWGWTEIDDETIEFTNAPVAGDVLQAFYQDKSSLVEGSPFHPGGLYP